MERDEIVRYWIESSNSDFQVMESLFDNGHYVWALFLSHLVIEKLLKAYHVKHVDANYPRIHNLVEISIKAKLDLSTEQKLQLEELTTSISGQGIRITRTVFKRRPPVSLRKTNSLK